LAEASIVRDFGFTSLLPPGRRQNPIAVAHSGYGFEVKACTTEAAEYKAKMRAHDASSKRAYARKNGLKPATAIVVLDFEQQRYHVYWREGVGNYRLGDHPGGEDGWKFMGTGKLGAR
jgi:hypothetical protein